MGRATEHPLHRAVTAEHCGELGRDLLVKDDLTPITLGYEWRQESPEVAHGRRRVDDVEARREGGPVGRAGAKDAPYGWPISARVRQQRGPAHLWHGSACNPSVTRGRLRLVAWLASAGSVRGLDTHPSAVIDVKGALGRRASRGTLTIEPQRLLAPKAIKVDHLQRASDSRRAVSIARRGCGQSDACVPV